ncbi:MAG: nucleoside triphosphate pyrophosphohydrolase [Halioglobus sp.]
MSEPEIRYSVEDLLRVMQRLRDPKTGCPWDIAQTFKSIVPSTLEECYELAEAIELEDYPHVAEELGDVLFQVIFYAQLGREQKLFEFGDVVHTLVDKLLRRHPHVFHRGLLEGVVQGTVSVEQVKESWEDIKRSERDAKKQSGVLDDVPLALPALPRAQKLQKRAAGVGFDWPGSEGVIAKLREELAELNEAVESGQADAIEDEMGDVLFTCVNLARHLGVDSETSLRRSSNKFESRFRRVEALALEQHQSLDQLDDAALDVLWETAKVQS